MAGIFATLFPGVFPSGGTFAGVFPSDGSVPENAYTDSANVPYTDSVGNYYTDSTS